MLTTDTNKEKPLKARDALSRPCFACHPSIQAFGGSREKVPSIVFRSGPPLNILAKFEKYEDKHFSAGLYIVHADNEKLIVASSTNRGRNPTQPYALYIWTKDSQGNWQKPRVMTREKTSLHRENYPNSKTEGRQRQQSVPRLRSKDFLSW